MKAPHIPVLLNEVISSFENIKDGYLLDCTLGFGGHSEGILKSLPNIEIIACDQDQAALDFCNEKFKDEKRIKIKKCNFSSIFDELDEDIKISGILADIGVSSLQLDDDERGFCLSSHSLDMRMDKSKALSATNVINEYSKDELERIFYEYGELKMASKIAQNIIQARAKKPISSCYELAKIIGDEKIFGRSVSIAKLAFQAIRIEVNDELGVLKSLLDSIEAKAKMLKGAILAIIDFHSLEDRIIKERFKKWSKACVCDESAIRCTCGGKNSLGKIITKKPITASSEELKANPRANCAKMRVFEFNC